MGDGDGKGSDKPKRPHLPKDAPKDVKEFVGCKADSLEIKGGPLDWIDLPLIGSPNVSFEEDRSKPGTVKATAGKAGISVSVTITVKDGQVDVDASGIPGAERAKDWAKGLNDWLRSKKKKIGGVAVKNGALSITKSSIAAAAKEGLRGAALPTWEKVGAGALLALVTLGGVAARNVGDDTTRRESIVTGGIPTETPTAPKLAVGGFCVHHDQAPAEPGQSVIELRAVVEGVPDGDRLLAKFDAGPNGGSASGVATASNGFVDVVIEVTGRGPGVYTGFLLTDQTTGATLAKPVALDSFEVVPRNTQCPSRDTLVRRARSSTSSSAPKPGPSATTATTDAPPWSLAIAGGLDTLIVGGLLLDIRRRGQVFQLKSATTPDFADPGKVMYATQDGKKYTRCKKGSCKETRDMHPTHYPGQHVAEWVPEDCTPPCHCETFQYRKIPPGTADWRNWDWDFKPAEELVQDPQTKLWVLPHPDTLEYVAFLRRDHDGDTARSLRVASVSRCCSR